MHLFQRFPQLEQRLPRVGLTATPTPVQRLSERLWVKRDDVTSPRYGGNKVRKLEFLLADARRSGARRLLTTGAVGSHHALATTIHGADLGFASTLVLLPQPPTPHVSTVLRLILAHGGRVRLARSPVRVPLELLRARLAHRAEGVALIPAGGSNALGTLGYVEAALELAAQVENGECPAPAEVHVAGGTLGTAAGIALGLTLAGLDSRVVAHRITVRAITNARRLRGLLDGALRLLAGAGAALPDRAGIMRRVTIGQERIGRGYGHATPEGEHAAAWFHERGIHLDATYTAKAAAGALASGARGPVLYWHTLSSTEDAAPAVGLPVERIPPELRPFAPPLDPSGGPAPPSAARGE